MRYLAALLSVLFVTLGAPATAQQDDRGFLVGLLEDNLSSAGREVRITGFEGALSSRARIDELTIADDAGVWLTMRDLVLDWNRSALLGRRLEVNELGAGEVELTRLPETEEAAPSPEAQPFSLPELPISVRIGALRVDSVHLGAPLLGEPVHLSVQGAAELGDGAGEAQLEITRRDGPQGRFVLDAAYENETRELSVLLNLEEEADGIAARLLRIPGAPPLSLSVEGAGPLDSFAAETRLATDGEERLSGRVELLSGDAAEDGAEQTVPTVQRFRAEVSGDMAPLLAPQYEDFFGEQLALTAQGARHPDGTFELATMRLSARALDMSGQLRVGPDGLPEVMDLDLAIKAPDGTPVTLPAGGPPTTVEQATARLEYDAARGDAWRLDARVSGLSRPDLDVATLNLAGDGRIARDGGRSIAADLDLAASGIAPADQDLARAIGERVEGRVRLSWSEGAPVTFEAVELSGADYGISGSGQVEGARISGAVEGRLDDISRFSGVAGRPLSGALRGNLSGEAELLSGAFDAEARLTGQDLAVGREELDNLLAGRSTIDAALVRDESGTTIRRLNVNARTLSAQASGTLRSAGSDITATLDFSDLSVMGTRYGGAMQADARLRGTTESQRLDVTATGTDLAAGQPEVDSLLRGRSRLELAATRQGAAVDIAAFTLEASTLSAQVSGRYEPGNSDLGAELAFSDLSSLGARFGGTLSADAQFTEDGAVRRLNLTANGRDISVGQRDIDTLLAGTSELALTANERQGRIRVEDFSLRNPRLTAEASATVDGAQRRLDLSARLADLGLLVPGFAGPVSFGGRITEAPMGYELDLSGTGPGELNAAVTGQMAPDLTSDLAIRGGGQLGLINRFVDPISIQGPVSFDLSLQGKPRLEGIGGTVRVDGARIVTPRARVTLEDIAATAELAGGTARIDTSASVAAGGRLQGAGSINLGPGFVGDLALTLNRVRVVDPELYDTRISGDLEITGPLVGGGRIGGALNLEETQLRIPSTGFGAGGHIPEGLRHVNEPAEVRASRRRAGLNGDTGNGNGDGRAPFALDIAISAPNRIFVRGRGLDAELGGELEITGTTENVVPIGEFNLIRGRLDLLGNRFSLDEGYAALQGRLVPVIRLVATTESDGITTSIVIQGVATEPDISFVSSPELPEEEVVARLLFGRDLEALSPFQAAQLASAVATLAGRGGEGIVGNLRRGIGLDDLDIYTEDDGSAGVRAGKYITDNVYTNVTVDSDGRSEVSVNLDVSRSVTVRGRADSEGESGIGIFFERDY